MTALTKPAHANIKKPLRKVPIQETVCVEVRGDVQRPHEISTAQHSSRLLSVVAFGIMLLIMSCSTGLLLRRTYYTPTPHRFKGICQIPMPVDFTENLKLLEAQYRVSPRQWSVDPDMQVVSTVDEPAGDEFVNALREELDIGDSVEKIAVIDNGRRVDFIHDFTDNTTGIVDEDRCFVMDLEPEMVLGPAAFVAGLSHGEEFDVSRVRSALRAALPALRVLASAARLSAACGPRPVYRLYRDDTVLVKRSADEPPHDYIQFSGKHVQEIRINNLRELLEHERQAKA